MTSRLARWLQPALIIFFIAVASFAYRDMPGEDLVVGYIGCRAVVEDKMEVLYDHNRTPEEHMPIHPSWRELGPKEGFSGKWFAYVQSPLWAYTLVPACTTLSYSTFAKIFTVIAVACMAAIIWLSLRYLMPRNPTVAPTVVLAMALVWTILSMPFQYAMYLLQTHVVLMLAALAALILAERKAPISAGLLLAFAAAVKITPALLALYWLMTRQWKALGAFTVFSAGFFALTWALSGNTIMLQFIAELRYHSDTVVNGMGSVSLPAAFRSMQVAYMGAEPIVFTPMPIWAKLITTAGSILFVGLAGYLRHRGANEGATVALAITAMTFFAPLTWSHYYILLVIPMIYIAGHRKLLPFAFIIFITGMLPHSEFRPLMWGAIVAMAVCIVMAVRDLKSTRAAEV